MGPIVFDVFDRIAYALDRIVTTNEVAVELVKANHAEFVQLQKAATQLAEVQYREQRVMMAQYVLRNSRPWWKKLLCIGDK